MLSEACGADILLQLSIGLQAAPGTHAQSRQKPACKPARHQFRAQYRTRQCIEKKPTHRVSGVRLGSNRQQHLGALHMAGKCCLMQRCEAVLPCQLHVTLNIPLTQRHTIRLNVLEHKRELQVQRGPTGLRTQRVDSCEVGVYCKEADKLTALVHLDQNMLMQSHHSANVHVQLDAFSLPCIFFVVNCAALQQVARCHGAYPAVGTSDKQQLDHVSMAPLGSQMRWSCAHLYPAAWYPVDATWVAEQGVRSEVRGRQPGMQELSGSMSWCSCSVGSRFYRQASWHASTYNCNCILSLPDKRC